MQFYDLYLTLCNKRGVTPSRAAMEMGISKVAVTNWKTRGNYPTDANLQKIADYFGVPVEYLKGETENPSTESGKGDIKNWNVYTMGGEKPVDSVPVNVGALEYIEELVEITRTLPREKIKALLEIARFMQ